MFNPPYIMPICEFTHMKYSDLELAEEQKVYLKDKLFITVVELKDSPAFLGNRIGFQFINEALNMRKNIRTMAALIILMLTRGVA